MKINKKQAFTLVELLIVICVVSVLFVVLASRVDFATDKARTSGVQNDFRSFQSAIHSLALEQGEIVRDNQQLLILLNNKLDQEMQIIEDNGELYSQCSDPWGVRYKLSYTTPKQSNGCMFVQSAGPDNTFDTQDDLITSLTYNTANGKGDIVVDNIDSVGKEDIITNAEHVCIFNQQIQRNDLIASEATCRNPAAYYYTCRCGEKGNTTFSIANTQKAHEYIDLKSEQYLQSGGNCQSNATYYKSCKYCGTAGTEIFMAEKGEHDIVIGGEESIHEKCSICDAVINIEHSYTDVVVQDATCDVDGLVVSSCECGYSYETVIPAGEHTMVNGAEEFVHAKCTTCTYVVSTHDMNQSVIATGSCTTDRVVRYYCACGYEKMETTKATGHIPGAAATCQNAQICTKCSFIINPVTEHNKVGSVTCTTSETCSYCNTVLTPATGHQNTEIRNLVSATPTSSGYTGDTYCIDCNKKISSGRTYSLTAGLYESGSGYTQLVKTVSSMKADGWLDKDYKAVSTYKSKIVGDLYLNIATIGYGAFENCYNLTSISLGSTTKSIAAYAFQNCTSLTNANLGNATAVGMNMFTGCSALKTVNAPKVTSIGNAAFSSCNSLESITTGVLTSVSSSAFSGCSKLTFDNVQFKDAVIYNNAFNGCVSITEFDFSNIKTLSDSAFSNCTGLITVDLQTVESVGNSVFSGCTSLQKAFISRQQTLGNNIFNNCSSLQTNNKGNIGYIGDDNNDLYILALKAVNKELTSFVLDEDVYQLDAGIFKDCVNMTTIEIPDSVVSIGSEAFSGCKSLKKIVIPDSVQNIGSNAFTACNALTSVGPIGSGSDIELPGISTLSYLFTNCTGLKTAVVPDGVKTLSGTFDGCKNLVSVNLPEGITSIPYAFADCTSIKSIGPKGSGAQVELPNSLTEISHSSFNFCYFTSFIFPEQITDIDNFSINHNYCTSYVFPEGLEYIGDYAVGDNTKLTTMHIGSKLKSIGKYAFRGLSSLKTVYYAGTMEQWNTIRKGTDWNYGCPSFSVICSDGTITVPKGR